MSDSSDSEEDNSERTVKKENKEETYLNADLVYKVADSNGKELPPPYFKSNQPTTAIIGQSLWTKKLIKNILQHTLNELPEMIEVFHYSTLLSFGMGLAAIDRMEAPSH